MISETIITLSIYLFIITSMLFIGPAMPGGFSHHRKRCLFALLVILFLIRLQAT